MYSAFCHCYSYVVIPYVVAIVYGVGKSVVGYVLKLKQHRTASIFVVTVKAVYSPQAVTARLHFLLEQLERINQFVNCKTL